MNTEKQKRLKKRIKIKCLLCQREFDHDYRIRHNEMYHESHVKGHKHVPYETVNAVKNPFIAAAASTPKPQEKLETILPVTKQSSELEDFCELESNLDHEASSVPLSAYSRIARDSTETKSADKAPQPDSLCQVNRKVLKSMIIHYE